MAKIFSFIFLLLFCGGVVGATQIPICRGVEYTGEVIDPYTNETVLTLILNFNVKQRNNDQIFPNTVIFKNLEWNSSLPLQLSDKEIYEDYVSSLITWENSISFRNKAISFEFTFSYNESLAKNINVQVPPLFIMNGVIVNGVDGNIFSDDNDFCFIYQKAQSFGNACTEFAGMGYICHGLKTCCTEIEYMKIPDAQDEICTNFQNQIIVENFPDNKDATYKFEILLSLLPDNLMATFIEHPLDFLNDYGYTYAPFDARDSSCPVPILYANCTFPKNEILPKNFQYFFNLNFLYLGYNSILVGELSRRDGKIFKENNISYTPKNPCWNATGYVTNNNVATSVKYTSSLCCTKFISTLVTTTTTNIASSLSSLSLLTIKSETTNFQSTPPNILSSNTFFTTQSHLPTISPTATAPRTLTINYLFKIWFLFNIFQILSQDTV